MERLETKEDKEEIRSGIFFQYINSILPVLTGFIFYIYIIDYYSSEIVGSIALLSAIISLMSSFLHSVSGVASAHFLLPRKKGV